MQKQDDGFLIIISMSSSESFSRASSRHSSMKDSERKRSLFTPHKIITRSMARRGTFSTQADTNFIERKTRRRRKTTVVRRKLEFDESKAVSPRSEMSRENIIENLKNMSVVYWSKGIENRSPKQVNELPQFPIRC